jgi:3-oxoacyl-(acyl-carrier-protein) synthase
LEHNISISAETTKIDENGLENTKLSDIDVIVMHAPGTIKGDLTEYKAIQKLFGESLPLLTTNKWKIGHTFGASGMLSLELAILMMQHNTFIGMPFAKAQNIQSR